MATIIQDSNGNRIGKSRNLRGVLDRARKVTVDAIHCIEAKPFDPNIGTTYAVEFTYSDGSIAFTEWADWRVLVDWIKARRSWRVNRISGYRPFLAALAPYMAGQPQ